MLIPWGFQLSTFSVSVLGMSRAQLICCLKGGPEAWKLLPAGGCPGKEVDGSMVWINGL